LVILNFGDSTLDILANSSDKFIAVGASLGGLTVRKALADLPNHDSDADGWDDHQEFLIGTAVDFADSMPAIELAITPTNLASAAYPNMQYEIWYTDELGEPWSLLKAIEPHNAIGVTNEFSYATTNTPGFYVVSGGSVGPVTD
jgi:hypothetical protein